MGFLDRYRSRGLGLEAKRVHAIIARRLGVDLVTWTFDPLQSANANLNFRKLGCQCRHYLIDLYGQMGGGFDSGLPTDRFLVEWRLDTDRVKSRLAGDYPSPSRLAEQYGDAPIAWSDFNLADYPEAPPALLVPIPERVHETVERDPESARQKLLEFRGLFSRLFESGYTVVEMIRAGAIDGRHYYVLIKEVLG